MERPNYFDNRRVNEKMLRSRKPFERYDKFVDIVNSYTYSIAMVLRLKAHSKTIKLFKTVITSLR